MTGNHYSPIINKAMTQLSKHHQELNERGEGKCSVPMWSGGIPSGFCDAPAYSNHKGGKYFNDPYTGERVFIDGTYGGYVPALACPAHGGHTKEKRLNLCDYCSKHIAECDGKPLFGIGKGNDNVYQCEQFNPPTHETPPHVIQP